MIQITDKSQCCGCTACASICAHDAITMQPDKEGFLYPIIDADICTNCGLCETVCPIIYRNGIDLHPNQKALYAARYRDKETLMDSSSGGAFWALAELVIKKGGVVCGVEYSPRMDVRHAFAETLEDCKRFMGSKYVQSNINGIYSQIKAYLKNNRYVLFVGTPCQVEGLNLYLRKPYDTLITTDLVCHAVPSPLIFREYIAFVNKKMKANLTAIDMRYKRICGWSHRFSYRYSFDTCKRICDPSGISNWGRLYFSRLIDRPSCHECKFTNYHRSGDFTLADFWDDAHKRPDLYSSDGTSLFLVNTEKGMNWLTELNENLNLWSITPEEAWQPCLEKVTIKAPLREQFWIDYNRKGFSFVYRKYFTDSYKTRLKRQIKWTLKFIGLWKESV